MVSVREAGKQGFRSWSEKVQDLCEIVLDLWKIVQDFCVRLRGLHGEGAAVIAYR